MNSYKYSFLTFTGLVVSAVISVAQVPVAAAQSARIGISAPLSGAFAPLGEQLVAGARAVLQGSGVELVPVDDLCSAEGGKSAAEKLVQDGVTLVTGYLCAESLEAALPALKTKGIPVIAAGVSEPTLLERRAPGTYDVFRLTTGLSAEAAATVSFLGTLWRTQSFAIIEDGTMEGRERAGRVQAGLKALQLQPAFFDTYRPGLANQNALVSRLKRAGATHVYIGGERDDVAVIGASAQALKYGLTIAAGSQLDASPGEVELQQGTLMIAPVAADQLPAAAQAISTLHGLNVEAGRFAILGFAAGQIALGALPANGEAAAPLEKLRKNSFDTAIGSIRFNDDGTRADNPNRLQRFNGHVFLPLSD